MLTVLISLACGDLDLLYPRTCVWVGGEEGIRMDGWINMLKTASAATERALGPKKD